MQETDWSEAEELLKRWLSRTRASQHSHHEAGKSSRLRDAWLSVPVIVITAALGTAAFASIQTRVSNTAKLWFGVFSTVAAVLSALQTYFRYLERSEKHKNLGAEYGNVRRQIEEVLCLPPGQRGEPRIVLDDIRGRLDAISNEGPVVSRRIWNRTVRSLAREDEARRSSTVGDP